MSKNYQQHIQEWVLMIKLSFSHGNKQVSWKVYTKIL